MIDHIEGLNSPNWMVMPKKAVWDLPLVKTSPFLNGSKMPTCVFSMTKPFWFVLGCNCQQWRNRTLLTQGSVRKKPLFRIFQYYFLGSCFKRIRNLGIQPPHEIIWNHAKYGSRIGNLPANCFFFLAIKLSTISSLFILLVENVLVHRIISN